MFKAEEIIQNKLQELEQEEQIKILFAVESGSRAWGLESSDSDYDVRFVYTKPVDVYISLNQTADTIHRAWDAAGDPVPVKGSYIDVMGMDVLKYLRLLRASNPTAIEWLISGVVYKPIPPVLQNWVSGNFKVIALFHHYRSMCLNNYKKYVRTHNDLSYKRYLYAVRAAVNALYTLRTSSIPPMDFNTTLRQSGEFVPERVIKRIQEIIQIKKGLKEKEQAKQDSLLEKFIEDFLKLDETPVIGKQEVDTDTLDAYAQKQILG